MRLRPATASDVPLLRQATLANVNTIEQRFRLEDLDRLPRLAQYFTGFPGEHDFGLVAEDGGRVLGVVWVRLFGPEAPGYGFVRPGVPELSISVSEGHRGAGIGGRLLVAAAAEARRRGLPGLSLSVEDGNPARRLYERRGYRPVGREGNS